MESDLLYTGVN